jgi:hypothetical protein
MQMVWICARYRGLAAKNQGASDAEGRSEALGTGSGGPFEINSNFTVIGDFACQDAALREPFQGWRSFEVNTGFWDMTGNNSNTREALAADIRRQFRTEATKRFLRTLPAFRTEAGIPDRFRDLLDRLDGIEASTDGGQRRQ